MTVRRTRRIMGWVRSRGFRELQSLERRGYLSDTTRPILLGAMVFFAIASIGFLMFILGDAPLDGPTLFLVMVAVTGVTIAVSVALATTQYRAGKELDQAQAELLAIHGELELERIGRRALVHDTSAVVGAMSAALHAFERSGQQPEIFRAMSSQVAHLRDLLATPTATLRPVSLDSFHGALVSFANLRDLSLSVDLPAQVHVMAEPSSVTTILQNLLDNARKYAPGSPIRVRWEPVGKYVRICVEDRGPGLGENPEALFRQGARGNGTEDGFGIGLATGRQLAERNGGALWYEVPDGPGSRFVLKLLRAGPTNETEGTS